MEAGHFHLDNVIAVIDCNRLQIDGWVKDVMEVEPLAAKYASFGWEVLRVDGHDMKQLVEAFEKAAHVRQAGGDPRRHGEGQGRELHGESGGGTARRRTARSWPRGSRNWGWRRRFRWSIAGEGEELPGGDGRASWRRRCRSSPATTGGMRATR